MNQEKNESLTTIETPEQIQEAKRIKYQILQDLINIRKKGTQQDYFFKRVGIIAQKYHKRTKKPLVEKNPTILYSKFRLMVDQEIEKIQNEKSISYFIELQKKNEQDPDIDKNIKHCIIETIAILYDTTAEEVARVLRK